MRAYNIRVRAISIKHVPCVSAISKWVSLFDGMERWNGMEWNDHAHVCVYTCAAMEVVFIIATLLM